MFFDSHPVDVFAIGMAAGLFGVFILGMFLSTLGIFLGLVFEIAAVGARICYANEQNKKEILAEIRKGRGDPPKSE